MKKNNLLTAYLCLVLPIMYACGQDEPTGAEMDETEQTEPDPEIPDDPGDTGDDTLNTNSQNIHYENAILIAFSTNGVTITNPFENNGVVVENDNGNIVITAEKTDLELNYLLSGIITDGSLKIYGEKKSDLY